MCISRQALSQMKPAILASLCINELKQRRSDETTHELYCLELLHRAIIEQTDQAWSTLQQCFSETVRTWIHSHPNCDLVLLYDSEENLVAQTFSRFWYAMYKQHVEFTKLSAALCYLRATLNGIIIDTIRSHWRIQLREISLSEPSCFAEPAVEDCADTQSFWKCIDSLLVGKRERRLAYLLYFCGLKPREIIIHCPQEFDDVKEIYRLSRGIIERLRRNKDRLRHILDIYN